ncbi:MAG: Holliday junction branch migration protein RuvA [Planctomycetes bacterium]|nr:Holliday junction branch migration protein RuvA [Planctomycetota bacterium]
MYEFLQGKVHRSIPGLAIIEAGGIGYRVQVPLSTSDMLIVGADTRLLLHHTINAEQGEERLFGFATDRERELFLALLIVQGIGPSTALQMMCAGSPDDLINAIASGDVATLKRLKGIGPKRAERLVIELKDRLQAFAGPKSPIKPAGAASGAAQQDAVLALLALGYPSTKSAEAVTKAAEKLGAAAATDALVRAALQTM